MATIIQDNINPIEKMEKSMMMIGSVIHDVPENELIASEKKTEAIEGKVEDPKASEKETEEIEFKLEGAKTKLSRK